MNSFTEIKRFIKSDEEGKTFYKEMQKETQSFISHIYLLLHTVYVSILLRYTCQVAT